MRMRSAFSARRSDYILAVFMNILSVWESRSRSQGYQLLLLYGARSSGLREAAGSELREASEASHVNNRKEINRERETNF